MSQHLNMDAAESAFFDRQLEFIYSRTYDIKFPEFRSRQFVPTSMEASPGATSVTYEQFTEVGRARIGSHSSDKPPRVDVNGEEFNRPVRPVEASYGWTVQEVKSAQMAGSDLNSRRARACRRAIERSLDEVAAIGAPLYGIASGALNEPNSTIDPSGGDWLAPATVATILAEINGLYVGIINDTLGIERPDTLLLPEAELAHIRTTPMSIDNPLTIASFVEQNYNITIDSWYRLDTAGAAGVDRAMMYKRSPEIMQNEIPLEFEQLPVQPDGMQMVVYCHARTAGVAVYYPLAVRYLDGI